MKTVFVPVALALLCTGGFAKLPPPDDAAKAKAAETAAKNAWQAKVDGYQLCKAQDKIAAQYRRTAAATASTKDAKPVVAAPATAAAPAAAGAAAAPGAAPAAANAQPVAPGTPVTAASPPPPCTEPGPFAYNAPAEKPLETSGAHSPTGTAASPPSVKEPSAAMAPAKKP